MPFCLAAYSPLCRNVIPATMESHSAGTITGNLLALKYSWYVTLSIGQHGWSCGMRLETLRMRLKPRWKDRYWYSLMLWCDYSGSKGWRFDTLLRSSGERLRYGATSMQSAQTISTRHIGILQFQYLRERSYLGELLFETSNRVCQLHSLHCHQR